jgi:Leucine-rich repeat (LRR) protein
MLAALTACGNTGDGRAPEDAGIEESAIPEDAEPEIPDYIVEWADPTVELFIRRYLGVIEGDIYRSDLDAITRFGVEKRRANAMTNQPEAYTIFAGSTNEVAQVESIGVEDMRHFRNLTETLLNGVPLDDLSFLSGLEKLEKVNILNCGVEDIAPLSGLANLTVLYLDDNRITDLSPLSGLTNLSHIRLHRNEIRDVSALSGLHGLKQLGLGDNEIADYAPLYGLSALDSLILGSGVTEEQRAELQEALPFCSISG